MAAVHDHIKRVLFTEEDIKAVVKKMGNEINADYANTNELVVVGILNLKCFNT